MKRLPDWESRLVAYLSAAAPKAFAFGENDCALFTAGAVEAMTGVDLATKWRGKYRSLKTGFTRLAKAGFSDHVALAASLLPEVPPAFAWKGDIAVVPGDFGAGALGVVQGEGVYVLTATGLGIVPRLNIVRAFRL